MDRDPGYSGEIRGKSLARPGRAGAIRSDPWHILGSPGKAPDSLKCLKNPGRAGAPPGKRPIWGHPGLHRVSTVARPGSPGVVRR